MQNKIIAAVYAEHAAEGNERSAERSSIHPVVSAVHIARPSRDDDDFTIDVQFVNNSGIKPENIHVSFHGNKDLSVKPVPGYMNLQNKKGYFVSEDQAGHDDKFITLATLLDRGITSVPQLPGGRMTFGLFQEADFNETFTDPNQTVANGKIFDKLEISIIPPQPDPNHPGQKVYNLSGINTTLVDFLGIPFKYSIASSHSTQSTPEYGIQDSTSRLEIFQDFIDLHMDDYWRTLMIPTPKDKTDIANRLRLLNPVKMESNYASHYGGLWIYWDIIINDLWKIGNQVEILTDDSLQILTGKSDGDAIIFPGVSNRYYWRPSTLQIFNASLPTNPRDITQVSDVLIVKWLATAISRGVIYNDDPRDQGDPSKFYQKGRYNLFAQFIHNNKYTIPGPKYPDIGLAYGLPYDDVFNQSTYKTIPDYGVVTITLQSLGEEINPPSKRG